MKQLLPSFLKNVLKKYAWFWVYKNQLFSRAQEKNVLFCRLFDAKQPFPFNWNVFTREGEDGILLQLFLTIGTTNKQFIDIGSNDGINSNCANLALHHNWNGLLIDANAKALQRGAYIYQSFLKEAGDRFRFIQAMVTPESINQLLQESGAVPEPDLLCMDLDGNDYHIWNAIQFIRPRVVLTEVQIEKGMELYIPPYQQEFEPYEDEIPKGASVVSMNQLAADRGYTLVAANKGGYNLFFVRNDCMDGLPPASPATVVAATTQTHIV
jgi:hypothetical protein